MHDHLKLVAIHTGALCGCAVYLEMVHAGCLYVAMYI